MEIMPRVSFLSLAFGLFVLPLVMALIIDDGVRGRGHRRNIFHPNYDAAGAAYGPHARYGSVCSIDFASGYAEDTLVRAGSDVGNSF